jgi:hypothetical protein
MINSSILKNLIAFAIIIITFTTSCKRTEIPITPDPTPTNPVVGPVNDATQVMASVSGIVLDESNVPIANAVVTSGAATTTTNSNGMFIFQSISLSKENGSITAVKAGYFKGVRSFKTTEGKNHSVRLQLMQRVLSGTVNSATGGTINSNGGATIVFPANAFVTSAGAAYTGTVSVYSRWIDPTAANLPFVIPGDLRGVNTTGVESILETYGMVGAELTDVSGNVLKIAPGKTATVSFPIPASLSAIAPATIPLWHFDDATARWKENGTATKIGNTYIAQVDKFSFWNVDVPSTNSINLDYTLINATTNTPLVSTSTRIKRVSNGTYGYGITNNTGFVSGLVPKNEVLVLEVFANDGCTTILYSQNIGPFASNTSLGNILVTSSPVQTITFTGTLTNCTGGAVTNGYVSLAATGGNGAFGNTNATGSFSFSIINCIGSNLSYNYQGTDIATTQQSAVLTGSATNGIINLGSIAACGSAVNTNGVYIVGQMDDKAVLWRDGVPTFLSTSPNCTSNATDVFVSGNDIYVLGEQDNSVTNDYQMVIWKNGLRTMVPIDPQFESFKPEHLTISNNDIYFVYQQYNGNIKNIVLNKNGINTILSNGLALTSSPLSVRIFQGDVYVIGKSDSSYVQNGITYFAERARYWKNGQLIQTPYQGEFSDADIDNAGNIYYVGTTRLMISTTNPGGYSNVATYYRNGNTYPYYAWNNNYIWSDGAATFFDNNTSEIYTGGKVLETLSPNTQGIQNLVYWKGGNIVRLTNYNPSLNQPNPLSMIDIVVKNNKVYSLVFDGMNPSKYLYYENNTPFNIYGITNLNNFSLNRIFVK